MSVVLVSVGKEDHNSETLRSMLLASDVANGCRTHGWGSITSSTAGMSCSAMRPLQGDDGERTDAACAVCQRRGDGQDRGNARGSLSCSAYDDMSGRCIFDRYGDSFVPDRWGGYREVAGERRTHRRSIRHGNCKVCCRRCRSEAGRLCQHGSGSCIPDYDGCGFVPDRYGGNLPKQHALQVVQNNASAWAIFNASGAVMGKTVAELVN